MSQGSSMAPSHSMFLPSNPNSIIKVFGDSQINTSILPVMNVDTKHIEIWDIYNVVSETPKIFR